MPVMFHGYFKPDLWKMFVELSYLYRQICAKEVSNVMMLRLEKEIVRWKPYFLLDGSM
jgi:hypothetical protein